MTPDKYRDLIIPLLVFYSTTAFSATLLNILVIVTIWKTPSLRTPSRLLLCSLASTDLLVGIALQPTVIIYFILALVNIWEARENVSIVTSRLGYGLAAVSMAHLFAIAVDRFLAIKTKQNYNSIITKKRTLFVIISLWLVPGSVSAILRDTKVGTENATKIGMAFLILFLVTIATFYSLCFYYLKKLTSQVVGNVGIQTPVNQQASDFNLWKYKRSLLTMVLVMALALLSFLPFTILFSTRKTSEIFANPGIMHVCESFVIFNSTLNPILYIFRMRDLRQSMKNVLKRLRCP